MNPEEASDPVWDSAGFRVTRPGFESPPRHARDMTPPLPELPLLHLQNGENSHASSLQSGCGLNGERVWESWPSGRHTLGAR